MGKRKRQKTVSRVDRPWCWYCERDFEDDAVLLQHQRAKHFKCDHCNRRLNTAGGLAVHNQQVHKLELRRIINALPGRETPDIEIYGTEGIPAPDAEARRKRILEEEGLADPKKHRQGAMRPAIERQVIPKETFAIMLEQHKRIMGIDSAQKSVQAA